MMIKVLCALAAVFILLMCPVVMAAFDPDDYNYYLKIEIQNTTDNPITGPFRFPIDADGLITGYYILSDADDVRMLGTSHSHELMVAKDLSSSSAYWRTDHTTVSANTTIQKTMYFGNASATRSQVWVAADGDNCYAEPDASLSFNSGSSFAINADVTLTGTPVGECYIVGKSGNYELLVDDTPNFIFRVYEVGTATTSQNLVPSQYINNTASFTGGYLPSLLTDDSDSSYIHKYNSTAYTTVGLSNPTLPETLNVGTVTVYVRGWLGMSGGLSWVKPALRYDGAWDSGAEMAVGGSWAWHTEVFPTDPDGNSWSVEDMGDLELMLTIRGWPSILVSEAYVKVEGAYAGTVVEVNIPASVDTELNVTGYYINGIIGVFDGSVSASGSVSSFHTNTANIHVGEFNGYIDNVKVSTP